MFVCTCDGLCACVYLYNNYVLPIPPITNSPPPRLWTAPISPSSRRWQCRYCLWTHTHTHQQICCMNLYQASNVMNIICCENHNVNSISISLSSLQQVNSQSFGYYISQPSHHGNIVLPVLPRFDSNGQLII